MNIDWIETYLDVLKTRNFNISADNLGLTQSTVSHRIQKLEEALGVKLFTRGRAGATPTAAGLRFENRARNLRLEWRQAKNDMRQTNALRIGIQYDIAKIYSGQILEFIRKLYRIATIYVEVDYSQQMNRDLEKGNLDFALIYTPSPHPDLRSDLIGSLSYKMVAAQPCLLKDISEDGYTFPNISPAFSQIHRHELPALTNAILQCGQSDAIAQFMENLGGASYLIADLADQLIAQGKFFPVVHAPILRQEFYLAYHIKNRYRADRNRILSMLQKL